MVYSVWLRLDGEKARVIQNAIDKFAVDHRLASFPAHVTVATGLATIEDALAAYSRIVNAKLLEIDPVPVAVLDRLEWSTVVVLRVKSHVTDVSLPYPPHVSLCYASDASPADRVTWAAELASIVQLSGNVHAGDLEIWDTSHACSDEWFPVFPEKFADIAVNLTDEMFEGIYHEKRKHTDDRGDVISRSMAAGCDKLLVLGGSVEDSVISIKLACGLDPSGRKILTTVGVHPTRAAEFGDVHLYDITRLAQDARVAALGEMGLDADRTHFCPMDLQVRAFRAQIDIAKNIARLPLLLHFRGSDCFGAFVQVLSEAPGLKGVVHSFTGTCDEMKVLTSMGLSIGINGCSLRDEAFLNHVLPYIPIDKLLLETDSPYCDIRPTHPSYKYLDKDSSPYLVVKPEKWVRGSLVKGRNEPCLIRQVSQVVASIHPAGQGIIKAAYMNTLRLFPRFR